MSIEATTRSRSTRSPTSIRCRRSASSIWTWSRREPGQVPRRGRPSPRARCRRDRDGAGHGEPRLRGAAEEQDRRTARRDVAGGGRFGPGAAAPGRLDAGPCRRLRGELRRHQRHHRSTRAGAGQPSRTRVTPSSMGAQPEHARRADRAKRPATEGACCPTRRRRRQVNEVFGDVRESLPQTLANLEIVSACSSATTTGVEQVLVILPQGGSVAQTAALAVPWPGRTRPRRCRSTSRRHA